MNLAWSQAHCSPANEIKATFAFLPAFNYISGRTARAQRLNEETKNKRKNWTLIALWTVILNEENLVTRLGYSDFHRIMHCSLFGFIIAYF